MRRWTWQRGTVSPAPPKRLPHPPVAVGVVVGRMDLTDAIEQPLILDGASRPLAVGALVVGGRRHARGPADGLDAEALAMRVNERAHFGLSETFMSVGRWRPTRSVGPRIGDGLTHHFGVGSRLTSDRCVARRRPRIPA